MNSLNILSARVIGPTPPQTPAKNRSRSYSDGSWRKSDSLNKPRRSVSQHVKGVEADSVGETGRISSIEGPKEAAYIRSEPDGMDEKTPLLTEEKRDFSPTKPETRYAKLRLTTKKIIAVLTESLRRVLSTLASPGVYVLGGFYNERSEFSPLLPIRRIGQRLPKRSGRASTTQAVGLSGSSDPAHFAATFGTKSKSGRRKTVSEISGRKQQGVDSHRQTADSSADIEKKTIDHDKALDSRPSFQTSSSSEDAPQARRSIRIKANSEETSRKRKQKRDKATHPRSSQEPKLTVANLKSPTSPAASLKLTKYPRAPMPPRPLIPQRQPSDSVRATSTSFKLTPKTLVIDLDETLIHSLAKGGRMSSGHMVEVKLNAAVGYGGTTLGPQHPILYYVHKRPHCDDFLRKVCKWYNLVVFTASVQEYADPVIDWLEQERKYFSARYYRQHCTFRNGAYIKDLSSVEPDLSKVMILDNSPLSYIFHEGSALR